LTNINTAISDNAIVVWQQSGNIFANEYNASTNSWGTYHAIDTSDHDCYNPYVAIDPNGNAMVERLEGSHVPDLIARHYNANTNTWEKIYIIESNIGAIQDYNNLSMSANGD
jgi:hypothetical protein